jgi:hypothetical protein
MGDTGGPSGGLLLPLNPGATFSYVDPDVIYGFKGSSVFQRYNFSTGTVTPVHDPASCVPSLPSSTSTPDPSVSGDDQRLLGYLGGARQDERNYLYVYDKASGCRWYRTDTGQVGGKWGPLGTVTTGDRFLLHNARLSRDGKFIKMTRSGCMSGSCAEVYVWSLDSLSVTACSQSAPPYCGGHSVTGYGQMANNPGVADDMNIWMRPLDDLPGTRPLIAPLNAPGEWALEGHLSWNNARANQLLPVCMSTYLSDGSPIIRAWDNEILCIRTDGVASTVWRFAHTRTGGSDPVVWNNAPRGNVSPDGRFYVFTSDWEQTLGMEPGGSLRTDAFIVELASGDSSAHRNVAWTKVVNANVVGGRSLLKTGGCDGCDDAGAVSLQQIVAGDGYAEFTASETTTSRAVGLTTTLNPGTTLASLAFGVYLSSSSGFASVMEHGLWKADTAYATGDAFRVAVVGNLVRYSKNGRVFHTSSVPPTYPLVVEASLASASATIGDVVVASSGSAGDVVSPDSSPRSVVWTTLVNAAASGTSLQKSSGYDGCDDAGAASLQRLDAGNGYAEFTVGGTSTSRAMGLTNIGNVGTTLAKINFAIYLSAASGYASAMENGVWKSDIRYGSGDVFRVAVSTNQVHYSKNGSVFYTSTLAPAYPLVVRASMVSLGATIDNGVVSTP